MQYEPQPNSEQPQGKTKMYVAIIFILVIAFALTSQTNQTPQVQPATNGNTKPVTATSTEQPQSQGTQSENFNPFDRWLFVYDTDKGNTVIYLDVDTIKKNEKHIEFWTKQVIKNNKDWVIKDEPVNYVLRKYILNTSTSDKKMVYAIAYDKNNNVLDRLEVPNSKAEPVIPGSNGEYLVSRVISLANK